MENSRTKKPDFAQRMTLIFPGLDQPTITNAIRNSKDHVFDRRTISKWFSGETLPPSGEKRTILNDVFKELRSDYVPCMLSEPLADLQKRLKPASSQGGAPPSSVPAGARSSESLLDKRQPLRGCYQVVRPYSYDSNRLVLEVIGIDPQSTGEIKVYMYSYNFQEPKHKYSGGLALGPLWGFAALARPHEFVDDDVAGRCIVLEFEKPGGAYDTSCLSGLMLRGRQVKNSNQGPRCAIGLPFAAIKLTDDLAPFEVSPQKVAGKLNRLGESIYIGEIGTGSVNLWSLLSKISKCFTSEAPALIRTVSAEKIRETFAPAGSAPSVVRKEWVYVFKLAFTKDNERAIASGRAT